MSRDRRCDVALIGAGITGALVANALTAAGLSVIAIDRRHPAHGSTSASTALLQYELDSSLTDLIEKVGRERAVDAYRATLDGVRAIGRIAGELDEDVGFARRPTLYYASRARDAAALRRDFRDRRAAGLPSEILNTRDIGKLLDSRVPAKAKTLLAKVRRRFPRIEMDIAYAWAGTFGETEDGLPFLGARPGAEQRVLYALAYGANGMPFGAVAGEVLTAAILRKRHRYTNTFSFDR